MYDTTQVWHFDFLPFWRHFAPWWLKYDTFQIFLVKILDILIKTADLLYGTTRSCHFEFLAVFTN